MGRLKKEKGVGGLLLKVISLAKANIWSTYTQADQRGGISITSIVVTISDNAPASVGGDGLLWERVGGCEGKEGEDGEICELHLAYGEDGEI